MNRHPRRHLSLRVLVATLAATGALALAVPATTASAQPCSRDTGCRSNKPSDPKYRMGWILRVDADGKGSYWTYDLYRRDAQGHCFDVNGVGVGCP